MRTSKPLLCGIWADHAVAPAARATGSAIAVRLFGVVFDGGERLIDPHARAAQAGSTDGDELSRALHEVGNLVHIADVEAALAAVDFVMCSSLSDVWIVCLSRR